jgi:Flp pilus assembly pilin Flp
MRRQLAELWGDQDAVTSVEYSMLLALVAVAALVSWKGLGCGVNQVVWRVAVRLQYAANQ